MNTTNSTGGTGMSYHEAKTAAQENPGNVYYWNEPRFEHRGYWCQRRNRFVAEMRSTANTGAGVATWF